MTIADGVYRALAARLDELPHGFPPTPDGVELRILAKIFEPEEAALALHVIPVPEDAAPIAARAGRPLDEVATLLARMAEKGQLAGFRHRGKRLFSLVPFVVGIYEFQLPRMDAELAGLFEDYAPTLLRTLGGEAPAVARVLPVGAALDAQAQILAHDDVRAMIGNAAAIRLSECICRKERAAHGQACGHLAEGCMTFSSDAAALYGFGGYGRVITREEALAVLDRAEAEGLVHCTYNVKADSIFVCNCCRCCCGFLRGVTEFHAPHILVRSNYAAVVDAELCCACAGCAERCPMHALGEFGETYAVDAARCIGCGVCATACAAGAIALRERPQAERTEPPANLVTWAFHRAKNRSGVWRAAGQFAGIGASAAKAAVLARVRGI